MTLPRSFDWQPDPMAYRMQLRAEFSAGMAIRKVVESDPMDRPLPYARTVRRQVWNHVRRTGQIIGYEYRKAAGRQRYHADPKQFAVITGVTS